MAYAMLPSLLGTMPRGGLTSPEQDADAQSRAALEELRRRVARQQQAAGEASTAYQQAAGQPAESLSPLAMFLPALLGNIASVIAQQPRFAQEGRESVQMAQAELIQKRAQNLQALRENYQQQAEAARQLGNIEAEGQLRAKLESISRNEATLRQTAALRAEAEQARAQHGYRLEEIRETGVQQRMTAKEKPLTPSQRAAAIRANAGIDPETGLTDPRWYQGEVSDTYKQGQRATSSDGKAAAVARLVSAGTRRLSGESQQQMRRRLAVMRHPFETQKREGKKVPKALFTPAEIDDAVNQAFQGEGPLPGSASKAPDPLGLFR